MTSIKDEIVPIFRRLIDDNEEPYVYTDNALKDYIVDAVSTLLLDWNHDYEVIIEEDDEGDKSYFIDPDVEMEHKVLFAMQAKLQMLDSIPNTSFRSGSMSVTRKNDTQKRLQAKIEQAISNLKLNQQITFLITEFD